MTERESNINFILNNFMDSVMKLPVRSASEAVRQAITACLRFASRAAIHLNLSIADVEQELEEEWAAQQTDMDREGVKPKVVN